MVMLRNLFNLSYQRTVVPDYYGFFNLFYKKLCAKDPAIAKVFENTDIKKQSELLMLAITCLTFFSATLEPTKDPDVIAKLHGGDDMNLSPALFDIWLDCLFGIVKEKESVFDEHVDRARRTTMAPGIEYMKPFCSVDT